jgi:molybdopterin converting factor small subunit
MVRAFLILEATQYAGVTMRVTVLYFGMLKEIFGESAVMELDAGADVAGLIAVHRGLAAGFAWGSIAVAVNRTYARAEEALHEGDEVALLPPVSGGCYADGESPVSQQRHLVVVRASEILRYAQNDKPKWGMTNQKEDGKSEEYAD